MRLNFKQQKTVSTGSVTSYAGNYIYENSGSGDELKFFSHAEGYTEPNTEGGFDYVYQYKDHLGNIRLSYSDMNMDGVVAPPQGSVVFSDDLENSNGWDSEGANGGWSAPIDTSKGHLDNSSVKLHRTVSGGYYAHSNEWIPINNSEPTVYKFSGWVYLESSGYSWARLVLFMNENEEDSYYTEVNPSARVYTKNQWVYLEQEVTVPVNIDKINLRVDLYNGSPSVTAWFDELRIEKMESSEIVEENNYYPFGLEHKGYNNVVNGTHHPYGFAGKEENDELGLQWMDFGARNYDKWLGRWMNLDPLAEKMRRHSPSLQYNPVDRYKLGADGSVTYYDNKGGDTVDYLFVEGDLNNEIMVTDTSILPKLSAIQDVSKSSYHGLKQLRTVNVDGESQNDIYKLFQFASDNTNVEWSVFRGNANGNEKFSIGTYQNSTLSPGYSEQGFELSGVISGAHSHPSIGTSFKEEIGSMYGDRGNTQRHVNKYGESPYEKHVYFPDSGRLWNINSKTTQPSYIRNIRGNYKRFYFGSLNSK